MISLKKAIDLIQKGEIVAIPTETVYGLAADAFNVNAVKKIFDQKGRPADNPLIVHISKFNQLKQLAVEFPKDVEKLAERFWPGPLSIILKKKSRVPDIVTGGLDTVAIRMPDHPITLSLLNKTGPLTAPSANKSGRPSPTKPTHILEDFGPELPILDGGTSKLGLESTVLDMSRDQLTILRPGFITTDAISITLGKKVVMMGDFDEETLKKSPGTRFTHYKPKASVQWFSGNEEDIVDIGAYYLFHSSIRPSDEYKNIYSYNRDYDLFARDLYDHFRTADYLSCKVIYIEPFERDLNHPLIPALKDRIEKAANS